MFDDSSAGELGKLFMIGLEGTEMEKRSAEVLRRIRPGFVILFSRNYDNPEQLRTLLESIGDVLGYMPVVAIDQEGGRVLRLGEPFAQLPSPMACAATGDVALVRQAVAALATEMRAAGIDWDLAPVVDVNTRPENPVIGTRAFGDSVDTVVRFAQAFLEGLRSAGVEGCLKHFPGIGAVTVDPHYDLPLLSLTRDELEIHLAPFSLLSASAWMPTHVYVPELQRVQMPASLSQEVLTELARVDMGFDGLLVADDLLMGGVSNFKLEDRVKIAASAGMDVLTICHEPGRQLEAFEEFVRSVLVDRNLRRRVEESAERIERFHELVDENRRSHRYDMSVVGTQSRELMEKIATRAITLVRGELPASFVDGLALVLTMIPPRYSPVVDTAEGKVPKLAKLVAGVSKAQVRILSDNFNVSEAHGERVLLITFNAHMDRWMRELIRELDVRCDLVLVSLQDPYDAFLARRSIATYGSLEVQQNAAFRVLIGEVEPSGNLPVARPLGEEADHGD